MCTNLHDFGAENSYASIAVKSPEEYLQTALQAERTIAESRHETAEGIYWTATPETALDQTFYSGSAGIIYFYSKLYEATKEESFKNTAINGAKYLALHWKDFLSTEPTIPLPGVENSLYFGLGGIALILSEIHQAFGGEEVNLAIAEIVEHFCSIAKTDETGTHWSGSTALGMDGGVILLLIQLYERQPDESLKSLVLSAAKWYLQAGIPHESGSLEYNGFAGVLPFSLPNFEFGTSGSGYLLTRLYKLFGDEVYLEAAKSCALFLHEISVPQEKGCLVPYRTGLEEEPIFYLSSCHGPAGTAKFYYQLYKITGDKTYYQDIVNLVDGLESLEAPEKHSHGLWNNVSLCCGHAGLVQFFVGLYEEDHNERWKELAVRAASVLVGEKKSDEDGSVKWSIAWERIHPENTDFKLGYYDGAAGIASALLQVYLLETDHFHWNRLIDDPFPSVSQ